MLKKTKLTILFTVGVLGGIGLCIGGIWVPPLFGVGGGVLAASIGMLQGTLRNLSCHARYGSEDEDTHTDEQSVASSVPSRPTTAFEPERVQTYTQNNIYFMYQPSNRGDDVKLPDRPTLQLV